MINILWQLLNQLWRRSGLTAYEAVKFDITVVLLTSSDSPYIACIGENVLYVHYFLSDSCRMPAFHLAVGFLLL